MPISFDTESHGKIPIGFFNIDTDMILIKNYFVFVSNFCDWIINWTSVDEEFETEVEMYAIKNLDDIGHLMGAITGLIYTGFIGEVYKKFPFPENKEDFNQKSEGFKNRPIVEKIIEKFSNLEKFKIVISKRSGTITIGEFDFSREQFHDVISYIWRGGMPQWHDGIRPKYVEEMMKAVLRSKHWLFRQANNEE